MIFLGVYDQLSKETNIFGKKRGINDLRNQQKMMSFLTLFFVSFLSYNLVSDHLAREKLKNI